MNKACVAGPKGGELTKSVLTSDSTSDISKSVSKISFMIGLPVFGNIYVFSPDPPVRPPRSCQRIQPLHLIKAASTVTMPQICTIPERTPNTSPSVYPPDFLFITKKEAGEGESSTIRPKKHREGRQRRGSRKLVHRILWILPWFKGKLRKKMLEEAEKPAGQEPISAQTSSRWLYFAYIGQLFCTDIFISSISLTIQNATTVRPQPPE